MPAKLDGGCKGVWAAKVSGDWRVTFLLVEKDTDDVDYEDYGPLTVSITGLVVASFGLSGTARPGDQHERKPRSLGSRSPEANSC